MKLKCPIQKILLPIDGSEHSRRAVHFAGVLGASLGKSPSSLSVLRVITGSYLARHISYIDFRAEVLKESETFKRVALDHIEKNIKPLLDETEMILRNLGYEAQIEKLIKDGEPAREIIQTANEGKFTTIIMARRGLSELKGFLLGSVTNKVVHTASRHTVYIVGQQIKNDKAFPFPKILVPVDGSLYSMKGLEHIACLAADLKAFVNKITLLRVINMEILTGRWKEGIDSFDEAREILDKAKETLDKVNIPGGLITTKIRLGRPSEEILKEVTEEDYDLIVLGRKGRTALKDLLLGGVSTTVLHRCQNPTVAIVSTR